MGSNPILSARANYARNEGKHMGGFRVITDGSGDLPQEVIRERGITVINFFVMLGGGDYLQQNVDISDDGFYEWMVTHPGVYPSSSTPSTQDYLKVFTELAEAGEKAVVLCITEKFSNSYQTACIALDLLREDYPDAEITVINTMVNTVLQGLMVLEACNMRDAGVGYEEAVERLYEIRPTGRIFFTIGSIDYLAHGGRIGKLAGKVSSALGIRPVITLKEGEIFLGGVARGRAKSLDKTLKSIGENLLDIYTGRDLIITFRDGKPKPAPTITYAPVQSPLSTDDEQMQKWINDEKKWQDVFTCKPYDYLNLIAQMKVPWYDKETGKWIDKDVHDGNVTETTEAMNAQIAAAESKMTAGAYSHAQDHSFTDSLEIPEEPSNDDDLPF